MTGRRRKRPSKRRNQRPKRSFQRVGEYLELFDTTYLIDLINSDSGALKKAEEIDREGTPPALSVISMHEYLLGVYLKYYDQKTTFKSRLTSARQDISRFEILPLTQEIVETSAMIHSDLIRQGKVIGINDIYIAATAMQYNIELFTRNTAHFDRIRGLKLRTY